MVQFFHNIRSYVSFILLLAFITLISKSMYNLHAHALISGKMIIHHHQHIDHSISSKANPNEHTSKEQISLDKITSFFFVNSPILFINSNVEFINKAKLIIRIRKQTKTFSNNIFLRGPPYLCFTYLN